MASVNGVSTGSRQDDLQDHDPSSRLAPLQEHPCGANGSSVPSLKSDTQGDDSSSENKSPSPTPLDKKISKVKKQRTRSSSFPLRNSRPPPIHTPPVTRRIATLSSPQERLHAKQDVLKLSPAQIYDLTSAPESLPIRPASPNVVIPSPPENKNDPRNGDMQHDQKMAHGAHFEYLDGHIAQNDEVFGDPGPAFFELPDENASVGMPNLHVFQERFRPPIRPSNLSRSISNPATSLKSRFHHDVQKEHSTLPSLSRVGDTRGHEKARSLQAQEPKKLGPPPNSIPSPMQSSLPLPPFSMPTYLQLELASQRPSPLYIYRPASTDVPYESSRIKFERLLNFLLLPPELERILLFGALSCLDSWLYEFTIRPLRFFKALWILVLWAWRNLTREVCDLYDFIHDGIGRLWHRHRRRASAALSEDSSKPSQPFSSSPRIERRSSQHFTRSRQATHDRKSYHRGHRRTRSTPSTLQQSHKADILQGLLVIVSSMILTKFDASRMYHNIRGQAAIKLYVIYNVLEVFDKLFSALGQDILECLLCQETLDRGEDGRSKILRPFWMFILALVYTVIHSAALFYQVITLNVAVNSYSNALLTLLMSNQFVEIKGTVFKKIEKENLFQLTCADVVERFQLWVMLLIIALRNIIEVGGLSVNLGSGVFTGPSSSGSNNPPNPNVTAANPVSSPLSILPNAFTIMPSLLPFQVLGPYLLVLGSEMLVDWLKHAYITKFNATSSRIYGRFLDILAKDYYSHAFSSQNLTKRLGLPVIPLACLFIRATLQTYHMFLATNISSSPALAASTSLAIEPDIPSSSPPILVQIERIFHRALGHSSFGGGHGSNASSKSLLPWSLDDGIALATMLIFFLALYLLLLALKLALGMVLLGFARRRYRDMKSREQSRYIEPETKRFGGWGTVEVGEDRRKWIYDGDAEGLRGLREREGKAREREEKRQGMPLENVDRFSMVGKRIW